MTYEEFTASLEDTAPSSALSPLLQALWFAGNDDWEAAHAVAQDVPTADGAWVHAYLHRVEGDLGNASYWYHQAGKPVPKFGLQEEWERIVQALLA
jgi:hypothetical protein